MCAGYEPAKWLEIVSLRKKKKNNNSKKKNWKDKKWNVKIDTFILSMCKT